MCNEYAREIEMVPIIWLMEEMKDSPPFEYENKTTPNDIGPISSIQIRDKGIIVRTDDGKRIRRSMTWAWKDSRGKPVFNFVSEGRDFSKSDRVLIPATGFYEYTKPEKPKVKLKDRHLFTMKGEEWFWIAGIVKEDCFAMLTMALGPDLQPFHDRQICILPARSWMDWQNLTRTTAELFTPLPAGTLDVTTLRKDGVALIPHPVD
jgi:putative SOS response-associated peptidase YedK